MITFLEKIFGPSWRTSLWGWICAASAAISADPTILQNIGMPENWNAWVQKAAVIVAAISGGTAFSYTKDKGVTGGNIPANREAALRVAENKDMEIKQNKLEEIK